MSDTPNNEINREEQPAELHTEDQTPVINIENSTVFGKPEELGTKRGGKGNPWTKRITVIASVILAAGVLTGGWFLLNHFFPELVDVTPGTSSAETITLFSGDPDNVKHLIINGKDDSVTLRAVAFMEDAADTGIEWMVDGLDPSLTYSNIISYRVEDACELSATREMSADGEYGLDDPTMVMEMVMNEGDGYILTVGSLSPDGSGYYCSINTLPDRVFLVDVSKISLFEASPMAFVRNDVITALTADDVGSDYFQGESSALNIFDSIEISGTNIDGTIKLVMTNDDSKYNLYSLVSPITAFADEDTVLEILTPISDGLEVVDVVSLDFEADKAKYGLDKPAYDVTYKIGNYEQRIIVSATNSDSECYVALGDEPLAIYSSYTEMLPYEGITLTGLYTPYPFFENIVTVGNITVESPDGTYEFDLTHHEDEDDTDTKLDVLCNGKKIETASFRTFYQDLVMLSAISFTTEKQNGEAEVTITVEFLGEGAKDTEITLVRISDLRYHLSVNGTPYGISSHEGIKRILSDCKELLANGKLN